MFNHQWKKEVLTIPNFLSIFRLLLIPVYIRIYLNANDSLDYYLSGTILGISCLTDLADGKIAREYNMVSNVGKLLDPAADKLTQLSLIICLSGTHRILLSVLVLFLIKEIFQCVSMLVFIRKGKVLPGALYSGKVCTTILFGSLLLLILFPEFPSSLVWLLALTDTVFLIWAFLGYILAYYGKNTKLTDFKTE